MSVPASPTRIIQVGVGGFGGQWRKIIGAKPDKYVHAALVDVVPDALARAGAEQGLPSQRCFTSLPAALAAVGGEADLVVVVVPPKHHRQPVEQALAAGLPVVCEKPMADSAEDCAAMVAAARRAKREFAVSQNYRFSPAMQTARRLIAEGALGAIGQVRMDFWLHHDFRGTFRETMAHPLILDMAIHHFDLLRFVTGLDPVSVRAESWNPPWSQFRGDASANCLFTMTNGARVLYDGSWHARGQHTGWNGDWLIEGDRGCLRIAKDRLWLRQGPVHGGDATEAEVVLDPQPIGGQEALLDEVIVAIRAGRPAPTTGADNWLSVAMVLQAVASLTSGQREAIAPLAAHAK